MNESETDLQSASRPAGNNGNCEDLRRQITLLFAGLTITSFTLTAYLGLQARRASVELIAIKPRAEDAVKLLQQDDAAAQAVFAKLTEFGRTHPDFQTKILSKYKVTAPPPAAAPKK